LVLGLGLAGDLGMSWDAGMVAGREVDREVDGKRAGSRSGT
jgi:hypothetical protein